jgi:hypothetical protein
MILAATEEAEGEGNVVATAERVAPEPEPNPESEPTTAPLPIQSEAVDAPDEPVPAQPSVTLPPEPPPAPQPKRRLAKVAPRRSAEQVGATMDKLMAGLETRGLSRRTQKVSIPYSVKLDSEVFQIIREGEGSAASRVLEAFLTVPRDNLDAIAGGASVIAQRRRRPSRGGLGQGGTVTVNLDGPGSETLEVLARRSRLSCGAYLEGCILIWALNQGLLNAEDLA